MADTDAFSRTLSNESLQFEDNICPDDHLSTEQIEVLLKRAEARLKATRATTALSKVQSPTFKLPKLQHGNLPIPYVQTSGHISRADTSASVFEGPLMSMDKPREIVEDRAKVRDSLPDWYNLPRSDVTPELKRDLQLLNMRSVLDPHRMYKKPGKFKIPEYSQVGVIVEGPTEFFNGRIQNRDRKKTFVDEALGTEAKTGRFKMKYGEIQVSKTSGKKAYYKALKAKRKSGLRA